jgi:hypothetical protein
MNFKKFFSRPVTLVVLSISFFLIFIFVNNKQDALAVTKVNKYNVEVFKTDMRSLHMIKKKYNIPLEMQSCHTTILGKYFIEGHVPIKAINKLLKEQPDIDGIALPGMPIGTPGMPGEKEEPYVIYQLVDGKSSVFMTI